MAYHINEECISCGACEPECPVSCISEGDGTYAIDEDACTIAAHARMSARRELRSLNKDYYKSQA